MLRLNLNAHPLSYVNDQDLGTAWLSKVMSTQELEEGITITVDLANGQYQVLQLFFIWIASILVKWSARSEIRIFAQIQIQQCIHLHCFWALSSYCRGREGDSVGQGTGTAAGLRCAVRLCVWAGFWILGAGLTLKLNSSPQIKGTLWSWGETCVHTCVCLCATTVMVS